MKYSLFTIILLFFTRCSGPNEKNETGVKTNSFSAFDLDAGFALIDSMQVLYYDDPYSDSLRYSRFYSRLDVNDSNNIKIIKEQLHQPYVIKQGADSCRSEGKIYLYQHSEPVKTIYFSTKAPDCAYVYFIKDGAFYYFEIINAFTSFINSGRRLAVED
jgi:hypothetical protein